MQYLHSSWSIYTKCNDFYKKKMLRFVCLWRYPTVELHQGKFHLLVVKGMSNCFIFSIFYTFNRSTAWIVVIKLASINIIDIIIFYRHAQSHTYTNTRTHLLLSVENYRKKPVKMLIATKWNEIRPEWKENTCLSGIINMYMFQMERAKYWLSESNSVDGSRVFNIV